MKTINVQSDKLAQGIYNIILETNHQDCLIYGMLPKPIMDLLEGQLSNKLEECYAMERTIILENFEDDCLVECMNEVDTAIASHKEEITHQIVCKLLSIATKEGLCIV